MMDMVHPAENDAHRDATREVVENLGLIWPDEAESMHEEVANAVLAVALAVVKRACDIECKSPGKHTGCHAHEPYRALAATITPPAKPDPELSARAERMGP